jgi:hypothetical protein
MNRPALAPFALLAVLLLAGCSSRVVVASGPSPGPDRASQPKHGAIGPVASLKIPPGHFPAPGQCRIWIPGQPPGHQPSASACHSLHSEIPPGAWVLYRPWNTDKKVIEVTAYDDYRRDVVAWVGYFDARNGRLIGGGG